MFDIGGEVCNDCGSFNDGEGEIMDTVAGAIVCALYLVANIGFMTILPNHYMKLTRWEVLLCLVLFPATTTCCMVWVLIWVWEKVNNFMSKGAW